jgi:hypothetical protein
LEIARLEGCRFAGAQVAIILTLLGAPLVGLPEGVTLIILVVITALAAQELTPVIAVVLGAVAWAYYTGFVINQYGELTFGAVDDARLLLLLACAAAPHWSQ